MHEFETPGASTRQYCSSHSQFRFHRCRIDDAEAFIGEKVPENERPLASSIRHRWKRNWLCELQISSSWCTRSFKFVHRLGESSCRPAARTPWTGYIRWAHPTLSRSWSGVTTSTAVAKPCLGMHKLDNICSSSVYGLCVSLAPERG